ncbi:hypothetical protein CP02DC14_1732B, partial [Chlamydia psittaci 02DC14]
FLRNCFVFW